jgi:hypothetical protein
MRVRVDSNGIPVMSRADIERRAELFLQFFDAECLRLPKATPIATIAARLRDEYGVTFIFNAQLGASSAGYKYRGRIHVPSRTIYVDESLPIGGHRFNFTLAHEIAHFVLHRRVTLSAADGKDGPDILDTSRDLILDQIQSDNPRSWLEWQANTFAASALMPRTTVPAAVVTKQRELGVTRNLGQVYLDRHNHSDFRTVLDYLGFIYQVSRATLRLRLGELNILHEPPPAYDLAQTGPRSIGEVLGAMMNELTGEWTEDDK